MGTQEGILSTDLQITMMLRTYANLKYFLSNSQSNRMFIISSAMIKLLR